MGQKPTNMKNKLFISTIFRSSQTAVLAGLVSMAFLPVLQFNTVYASNDDPKIYYNTKIISASSKLDKRTIILKKYLAKYNSPLEDNAADFIMAADKHGLDWKLLPSIAGVESTFGKYVPGGLEVKYTSYNAWGWGVYGTQAIYFDSWKDGINIIAESLKANYVNKGLDNPYEMNRVYAASPIWGSHVSFFIKDLEKFSAKNYYNDSLPTKVVELEDNIAGNSGQIQAGLKMLALAQ